MTQIIAYIVSGIAITVILGTVTIYTVCCFGIDIFKKER